MRFFSGNLMLSKPILVAIIILIIKNFVFKNLSICGQDFHDLIELFGITIVFTGAFFVFGLLLVATMSDFKESEKIPCEIATNLEAIKDWIYLEFKAPRWGNSDL